MPDFHRKGWIVHNTYNVFLLLAAGYQYSTEDTASELLGTLRVLQAKRIEQSVPSNASLKTKMISIDRIRCQGIFHHYAIPGTCTIVISSQ